MSRARNISSGFNKKPTKFIKVFSNNFDSTCKLTDQTGFVSHFGVRQEPALLIHSTRAGAFREQKFSYYKGNSLDLKNIKGEDIQPQFLNARELIDIIKRDFGLDLRRNGNTGKKPLHLITCYSGGFKNTSSGAQLARATGRKIVCYGEHDAIAVTVNPELKSYMDRQTRIYSVLTSVYKDLNQPLQEVIHSPDGKAGKLRK